MSKTSIFVIGATSFVGKHLVRELEKSGDYSIKIMARSLERFSGISEFETDAEVVEADLFEPESLIGLFEPSSIVINLVYNREASAEVNMALVTNLIDACKSAKISRLVHLSTADVVGRNHSDLILEDTPCYPNTDYSVTKLKIEEKVLAVSRNEFDTVVLRPTAIIGAGGKNLIKLANDITSANHFKNYLKSCFFGSRRMNLVAIENVVSAIMYLMVYSERFNGDVFHISDDDSPSNNYVDVETILMQKFNVPEYSLPHMNIPVFVLSFILKCLGRDNVNPDRIYSSKKIIALGFKRTIIFESAVNEFAEWYHSIYVENNL